MTQSGGRLNVARCKPSSGITSSGRTANIVTSSIFSLSLLITLLLNASQLGVGSSNQNTLTRIKRQLTQDQNAPASLSTRSADPNTLGQSGGKAAGGDTDTLNQGDSSEKEEILSTFKCDFGTAEAPEMCKIHILDLQNQQRPSLGKLATWSHGSGKLALYQGGPLTDGAKDSNDTTSGGYIYFETSNLLSNQQQQAAWLAANQTDRLHMWTTDTSLQPAADPYSYQAQQQQQRQKHLGHQTLTSARLSVGNSMNKQAPSSLSAPSFVTPNLTASGPAGMCLAFQYAIQGLSADELRIQVNDLNNDRSRLIWASSESSFSNWTRGEVLYSASGIHNLQFSAGSGRTGAMSHQSGPGAGLGGSAKQLDSHQSRFRGYIALDEIDVQKHDAESGGCRGHCNFDGDLCGWTNVENGPDDDFDWTFGRGSDNLFTGPARDYTSSINNEATGSYLQIDSSYPRRPGDRATLISPVFQPASANDAMCMRLAVHMFGTGVGSLAIKIRYIDGEPTVASGGGVNGQTNAANQNSTTSSGATTGAGSGARGAANGRPESSGDSSGAMPDLYIWEMPGDSGNSWHQAQASVSSSKSAYQVVIEGIVGENHLGNIAIDEISFSPGPCPTSPPVASKNYADCTFEQSMCYWRNPDTAIHLDDIDWIRTAEEHSIHGPNMDHTVKKRSGSYLKLESTLREPKSGTRAFLLSPIFQPRSSVQCLSFYYYMFMRSVSSSGPNLGTLRVYLASNNELVPIWRLTNPVSSPSWKHARASLSSAIIDELPVPPSKVFQIAFEGIWGDASGGAIALDDIAVFDGACDIMPPEAKSVPGECTFDVDLCSWTNKTVELPADTGFGSTMPTPADMGARSPFIQSVGAAAGTSGYSMSGRLQAMNVAARQSMMLPGWRLATVDSRPVNLQDHTYKAPIGYIYVDVLEPSAHSSASGAMQPPMVPAMELQASEIVVAPGQQRVRQCLSFWFSAFGRQDSNQLQVFLSQASAAPQQASPQDEPPQVKPAGSPPTNGGAANNQAESESAAANEGAWRNAFGRLLWSVGLKNVTEPQRRKWQYGQVTLRADSSYIVRFVAKSSDGGFALDDVSFYDGACETRPQLAKVFHEDGDDSDDDAPASSGPLANTSNNKKLPSEAQIGAPK